MATYKAQVNDPDGILLRVDIVPGAGAGAAQVSFDAPGCYVVQANAYFQAPIGLRTAAMFVAVGGATC